jgi:hypothetical protein
MVIYTNRISLILISVLRLAGLAIANPPWQNNHAADAFTVGEVEATAGEPSKARNLMATRTSIWTTTSTTTEFSKYFWAYYTEFAYTVTATYTHIESDATSLPTVVVDTTITDWSIERRATPAGDDPIDTLTSSATRTSTSTWHLYPAKPTDLPAGIGREQLPCSECAPKDFQPDPQCQALGLRTACQGQCTRREDGTWSCRQMAPSEYSQTPDLKMGRACWGNLTEYKQLNTPCIVGDHWIGCTPCIGDEHNFSPRNWH